MLSSAMTTTTTVTVIGLSIVTSAASEIGARQLQDNCKTIARLASEVRRTERNVTNVPAMRIVLLGEHAADITLSKFSTR